jgi:hypothetical protein
MASDGNRLLNLIVDMAGEEGAATVVERFGGSLVSVPSIRPRPDNWLVGIFGVETALAIFQAFHGPANAGHSGGYMVELPLAERASGERNRREVIRLIKLGRSIDRIAREVGVSRRTVQRWRARLKKTSRTSIPVPTKGNAS